MNILDKLLRLTGVLVRRIVSQPRPRNLQMVVAGGPLPHGKYQLKLKCGHTLTVLEKDMLIEWVKCPTCNAG